MSAQLKNNKKKAVAYAPSAEAELCLQAWERHLPLPVMKTPGTYRRSCLKALDSLAADFGLTWPRIHAICKFAVEIWAKEGYIKSPYTLNRLTKKGDQIQYQAIEFKMLNPAQGGTNGRHNASPADIARAFQQIDTAAADGALRVYDPNDDHGVTHALPDHSN